MTWHQTKRTHHPRQLFWLFHLVTSPLWCDNDDDKHCRSDASQLSVLFNLLFTCFRFGNDDLKMIVCVKESKRHRDVNGKLEFIVSTTRHNRGAVITYNSRWLVTRQKLVIVLVGVNNERHSCDILHRLGDGQHTHEECTVGGGRTSRTLQCEPSYREVPLDHYDNFSYTVLKTPTKWTPLVSGTGTRFEWS